MRASAVQIGTLIKAYLILLIQPLVNVLRIFDLDCDSSNGLPDNLYRDAATRCKSKAFVGQRSFRKPHEERLHIFSFLKEIKKYHADVCWHDAGSGILGLDDNSLAT